MKLKPQGLKPGDTLGIVACSTPIGESAEATIACAYQRLIELGFKIVEAPNCRLTRGHAAGAVHERVSALHSFFADPAIDGILSYWGGDQSHQLLEYLDFDLIRRHPKALIGYSDTTALQVGIWAKTGIVGFSGPAGITFGKPTLPAYTWESFENVLMKREVLLRHGPAREFSDNPWYKEAEGKMIFQPSPGWKVYRAGNAAGTLIGGNLRAMLLLAGTEYWPKLRGTVLFVEAGEAETPQSVDRMFTQLRQMGVYRKIAAMVIGRFPREVKFSESDSLEMILDEALKGYGFPVLTGVDFGHTDPLLTVPIGIRCSVDTTKPEIVYLESAVS